MSIFRLISTREENSINPAYLEDIMSSRFNTKLNIKDINTLDPANDILLWGMPWAITDQITKFLDDGGKCIFDALWEHSVYVPKIPNFLSKYKENIIALTAGDTNALCNLPNTISIPNWFWYNESKCYRDNGYQNYLPHLTNKSKKFFMPIRKCNIHRKQLFNKIQPELSSAVWSFVELGTRLPGYPNDQIENQRYFNPDWYDSTYFSVVCESTACSTDPQFITEKTFKPIAYYHPYIILGQPGILSTLTNMGFSTFPEVFNEAYDKELDLEKRINMIIDEIKNFNPRLINQPSVQEKLQHNHNLFFNDTLVTNQIRAELVEPLCNWLAK